VRLLYPEAGLYVKHDPALSRSSRCGGFLSIALLFRSNDGRGHRC